MPKQSVTKKKSAYKPTVPAVDQASNILLFLGKSPKSGMTLTEICKEVNISSSKGYTLLHTLKGHGFVEKNLETKKYTLGFGLLFLARNVLDNLDLREMAAPQLDLLAQETKNAALFGVLHDNYVYIVAKTEGDSDIGITIRVGQRFHMTHGAHGKAIAAFLPPDELALLLAKEDLFFYGRHTPLDLVRLKEEISQCRQCGYAYDPGELNPGIQAVSSPVFSSANKIIGCVILIGTFPITQIPEYGLKTADSSLKISRRIGYLR